MRAPTAMPRADVRPSSMWLPLDARERDLLAAIEQMDPLRWPRGYCLHAGALSALDDPPADPDLMPALLVGRTNGYITRHNEAVRSHPDASDLGVVVYVRLAHATAAQLKLVRRHAV